MIQGSGSDKGLGRINSDQHPEDEEKPIKHKGQINFKIRDGGSTSMEAHKLEVNNKININQETDKSNLLKSNVSITERDIEVTPLAHNSEYQRSDSELLLAPYNCKNQAFQFQGDGKLIFVGRSDNFCYNKSNTTGKEFHYNFKINNQIIDVHHCLGPADGDEIPSIDSIKEALHKVPPELLQCVRKITVNPKPYIKDQLYAKQYGHSSSSHVTMVASPNGIINIFPNEWDDDSLLEDLCHECGHLVDYEIDDDGYSNMATGKKTQTSKFFNRWEAAIDLDNNVPSNYAKTSPGEDFAESVVAYFQAARQVFSGDPKAMDDFVRTYPERNKILEDVFEYSKVVKQKRGRLARDVINNVLKTASEAADSNNYKSLRNCIVRLKRLDPGNALIPKLEEKCSRIEAEHLEERRAEVIGDALEASRNNDSRALKRYISKLKKMDPDDQYIPELKELYSKAKSYKRKRKADKLIKSELRAIRNEDSDKLLDLILKLARLDPHNENISKLEKKYVEMQESIKMKKIIKSKIECQEKLAWKNAKKNDSFEMEVNIKLIKEFDPDNKNLPSLQQAYLKAKNADPKRKRSKAECDKIMANILRRNAEVCVDWVWRAKGLNNYLGMEDNINELKIFDPKNKHLPSLQEASLKVKDTDPRCKPEYYGLGKNR